MLGNIHTPDFKVSVVCVGALGGIVRIVYVLHRRASSLSSRLGKSRVVLMTCWNALFGGGAAGFCGEISYFIYPSIYTSMIYTYYLHILFTIGSLPCPFFPSLVSTLSFIIERVANLTMLKCTSRV